MTTTYKVAEALVDALGITKRDVLDAITEGVAESFPYQSEILTVISAEVRGAFPSEDRIALAIRHAIRDAMKQRDRD